MSFALNAVVKDVGREIRGIAAIKEWATQEIFAVNGARYHRGSRLESPDKTAPIAARPHYIFAAIARGRCPSCSPARG